MAIITISREIAALGEEIAAEIARLCGYRIVDRDYLERRLAEHGIGPEALQKYDEKRPGFWSSLSEDWSDYLMYLKLALFEEASGGGCIIIGRGGSVVFRRVPSHLAIRITAPLDIRVARTMKLHSFDERRARQIVDHCDHSRMGFSRIYFGIDWSDPREFDLCINTARLGALQAAAVVKDCIARTIGSEEERAGKAMVQNLLLAQKVQTEICCGKKLHLPDLEVSVEDGIATLSGLSNTSAAMDLALATAREVAGVRGVKNAMHLVREYSA
jgi:cytidylate kinase